MLVLATVFQCLDPMLTIAACLSSKPVFLNPMDERDEATKYDLFPISPHPQTKLLTEHAHALRRGKATSSPTSMLTTSACEYTKKTPQEPCAHSVPTYVPSLLSTEHPRTCTQNYISATTIRDIKVLRSEFRSALQSAGLVSSSSAFGADAHKPEPELLKALLLAALYPRVARIALPRKAVKYTRVASGTVENEAGAREWRARDMRGERVWVHPASVQFAETRWRSGVVVSFRRVETTKVFLRDVTEVGLKLTRFVCLCVDAPPLKGSAVCAADVWWAYRRGPRSWWVDSR